MIFDNLIDFSDISKFFFGYFFFNVAILIKVFLQLADKQGITNLKNVIGDERVL